MRSAPHARELVDDVGAGVLPKRATAAHGADSQAHAFTGSHHFGRKDAGSGVACWRAHRRAAGPSPQPLHRMTRLASHVNLHACGRATGTKPSPYQCCPVRNRSCSCAGIACSGGRTPTARRPLRTRRYRSGRPAPGTRRRPGGRHLMGPATRHRVTFRAASLKGPSPADALQPTARTGSHRPHCCPSLRGEPPVLRVDATALAGRPPSRCCCDCDCRGVCVPPSGFCRSCVACVWPETHWISSGFSRTRLQSR